MDAEQRGRVRALNDLLRQTRTGGRIMLTSGVAALGPDGVEAVLRAVAQFDTWSAANDPYDEHDFGAVEAAGQRVFWKIDYLTPDLMAGAEDPADPRTCLRILTIMLASEY